MRNVLRIAAIALLLGAIVPACSCEDPPASKLAIDPLPSETNLDWAPQCNGSNTAQTFVISNGSAGNGAVELSIVGTDAEMFEVEPASFALNGPGAEQTVTVRYKPVGEAGLSDRHNASVRISWQANGKDEERMVTLRGDLSEKVPAPFVHYYCGDEVAECQHASPGQACCTPQPITSAQPHGTIGTINLGQSYRNVPAKDYPVVVANAGCADLNVTEVFFRPAEHNTCDHPNVVEVVTEVPFVLAGASGGESVKPVMLRFTPSFADENATGPCTLAGDLVFVTDDPEFDTFETGVVGSGKDVGLSLLPSFIDFGEVAHPDVMPKTFKILNIGSDAFTLTMEMEETDSPYSVKKVEYTDCDSSAPVVVPAAGGAYPIARSTGLGGCGPDELTVTVEFAPTVEGGPAQGSLRIGYEIEGGEASGNGTLMVTLVGGTRPALGVTPDEIAFHDPKKLGCDGWACGPEYLCEGSCERNDDCTDGTLCIDGFCRGAIECAPTCGTATKQVEICNHGKAPLQIDDIFITDTRQPPGAPPSDSNHGWDVFRIGDDLCSGKTLQANTAASPFCCTVNVEFKDTNTGGSTFGYLWVESNDPSGQVSPRNPDRLATPYNIESLTTADEAPTLEYGLNPDNGEGLRKSQHIIDLSASFDKLPDGSEDGEFDIKWEFQTASNGSDMGTETKPAENWLVLDESTMDDPRYCRNNLPKCYECLQPNLKGDGCRIMAFWPDLETVGTSHYSFRVTLSDRSCDHPHTTQQEIQITVK